MNTKQASENIFYVNLKLEIQNRINSQSTVAIWIKKNAIIKGIVILFSCGSQKLYLTLIFTKTFFLTRFFQATLFFNPASVLLNFFMNGALNIAWVLLNTYTQYQVEAIFIFTISRFRSIYVVSIFHFHLHFHYEWVIV